MGVAMSSKPRNYLNNHDLLIEIHKSKNSFSSYTKLEYHQYDVIVDSIEQISENIDTAKQSQAKRIAKEQFAEAKATNNDVKLAEFAIDANEIPVQNLIFRVMTFDHIPIDTERKKNPRTTADHHVRVNFPPFQHWKYDENGFLRCVGKSHWKGPVDENGFSKTHGKPTDKLGLMWMKMCDRYSSRGNLRSYTYNDEMRSQALVQLVEVGLQFNEFKSSNPFSYLTSIITNSCIRILNAEKMNQQIRDDILEENDMDPSYTRQHQYEWEASLRRNKKWENDGSKIPVFESPVTDLGI